MSAQAYSVADERCLAAGGQLASIKNAFTGSLLTNTLQNMVCDLSTLMWLGGNRIVSAWHWSDGTPFTYTNWAPGQPGNGSCLVFQPLNGQWSALGCESNKQPYICEFAESPIHLHRKSLLAIPDGLILMRPIFVISFFITKIGQWLKLTADYLEHI
uniref:C-type lectin domain-containing protein n=1 Tax=Acrobeloides nanus TaxID=290746 RepID=A0A914C1I6_9BILA